MSPASRLGSEAELDQRQRLQKFIFQEGLEWADGEIRTAAPWRCFHSLEETSGGEIRMVAQTVGSSNTKWDSNTLFAWLHDVAALRRAA